MSGVTIGVCYQLGLPCLVYCAKLIVAQYLGLGIWGLDNLGIGGLGDRGIGGLGNLGLALEIFGDIQRFSAIFGDLQRSSAIFSNL